MVMHSHRDNRPIYSQIVDSFRERIATGILQPGDKLPSVRELAADMAINPNTIQRAYRELENAGWIATVPGKGCFVHGIPTGTNPEQQALLDDFDHLTQRLLAAGLSREDLIRHLSEGGK